MSEISTIIRQFLEDQKADFLAKRISQETRDKKIKCQYVHHIGPD